MWEKLLKLTPLQVCIHVCIWWKFVEIFNFNTGTRKIFNNINPAVESIFLWTIIYKIHESFYNNCFFLCVWTVNNWWQLNRIKLVFKSFSFSLFSTQSTYSFLLQIYTPVLQWFHDVFFSFNAFCRFALLKALSSIFL